MGPIPIPIPIPFIIPRQPTKVCAYANRVHCFNWQGIVNDSPVKPVDGSNFLVTVSELSERLPKDRELRRINRADFFYGLLRNLFIADNVSLFPSSFLLFHARFLYLLSRAIYKRWRHSCCDIVLGWRTHSLYPLPIRQTSHMIMGQVLATSAVSTPQVCTTVMIGQEKTTQSTLDLCRNLGCWLAKIPVICLTKQASSIRIFMLPLLRRKSW
ncbi:hypothetical protein BJ166DRAFT_96579 [Pestalotiopsis sp. NC0098]|nr:hypothetical protein BJ166DRAFT_96579 [Pestalotiopsis sp. NC0098]